MQIFIFITKHFVILEWKVQVENIQEICMPIYSSAEEKERTQMLYKVLEGPDKWNFSIQMRTWFGMS